MLVDTLFQGQQLLRPERLVMDLRSGLNEILQVCSSQEVSQLHEFAVVGILDVHNTPAGLAATNRLAVNDDVVFGADDGERNYLL